MKRVLVMSAILACLSLQANAEVQPKGAVFYGGAGLTASLTKSDFNMDYSISTTYSNTGAKPYANHEKNHIGRIGAELFIGVKSKCKNGWFWAGELSYGFAKSNHKHDFTQDEDTENGAGNPGEGRISYIDVEHGNEIGLVGKFGRSINFWNIYGILGCTTKEVKIKYGFDVNHRDVLRPLEVNPKKRVYGVIFGLGASKQVHDKVSCAVEYKYKLYQDAKKDVDLINESRSVFDYIDIEPLADHDTSPRHFKVKSDKHELSLRVAVNI